MMKLLLIICALCLLSITVSSEKVNVKVNVNPIRKYFAHQRASVQPQQIPVMDDNNEEDDDDDEYDAAEPSILSFAPQYSSPRCTAAGGRCQGTCNTGAFQKNMGCPGPAAIRCCVPHASNNAGGSLGGSSGGGGGNTISGIPAWGQKDPRWASTRYAFGGGTLGSIGCTMTAVAMAAAWKTGNQAAWTPDKVNGKYGGALSALAPFNNLHNLSDMYDRKYGSVSKANSGPVFESIKAEVRAGHPVFVGMMFPQRIEAERWSRHTVLAVGVSADGSDVIINDPATGAAGSLKAYMDRPQFTGFDKASSISK